MLCSYTFSKGKKQGQVCNTRIRGEYEFCSQHRKPEQKQPEQKQPEQTDPKLEKLEKLLTSYAKEMHGEGFDLNVEELFDGSLSDTGYEELDYTMDAFSEPRVREIAARIFSNFK